MVKLTIAFLICDRDYQFVEELLKNIQKKVKISHNVLIGDNRKEAQDIPLPSGDYRLIKTHSIAKDPWTGRLDLIEHADGEYVWLIDADDKIDKDINFDFNQDLYYFNSGSPIYKSIVRTRHACFRPLWELIFKNSVGKTVYQELKKRNLLDLEIYSGEDTIMSFMLASYSKSIEILHTNLYTYNSNHSFLNSKKTIEKEAKYYSGDKYFKTIMDSFKNVPKVYYGIRKAYYFTFYFPYVSDYFKKRKHLDFQDLYNLRCSAFDTETIFRLQQYVADDLRHYKIKPIDIDPNQFTPLKKYSISVVCAFWDGDYKRVEKFVRDINYKLKIDHEIILVDNREKFKDVKINFHNAQVVDAHGNVGIFNGRRLGAEAASKDYVWFIDTDDGINFVYDIYDTQNADLVYFNNSLKNAYVEKKQTYDKMWATEEALSVDEFNWSDKLIVLHTFWIKRQALKRAYQNVSEETKKEYIVFNEDVFLLNKLKCVSKTAIHILGAFYVNKDKGVSDSDKNRLLCGADRIAQEYLADEKLCHVGPLFFAYGIGYLCCYSFEKVKMYKVFKNNIQLFKKYKKLILNNLYAFFVYDYGKEFITKITDWSLKYGVFDKREYDYAIEYIFRSEHELLFKRLDPYDEIPIEITDFTKYDTIITNKKNFISCNYIYNSAYQRLGDTYMPGFFLDIFREVGSTLLEDKNLP